MARMPITVMGHRCERCRHFWILQDTRTEPSVCPRCRSPYWNRPRHATPSVTYQDFRDRIRQTLEESGSLTWAEVRTKAQLPQRAPSTQWIHRMQIDIGLQRKTTETESLTGS